MPQQQKLDQCLEGSQRTHNTLSASILDNVHTDFTYDDCCL